MALAQWWRRLFRRRRKTAVATAPELLGEFQEHIGFRFRDPALLQQALTHRSFLGANGSDLNTSNERMEFLGDSVLELVVNEHLYARHPDLQEGELTKMKSLLVSRGILSNQAREMGLGRYLLLSEAEQDSGGRERPSILADTFEAVVGAIYLDGGLESARGFLRQRLLTAAQGILGDRTFTNYKSLLQEFVQSEYRTYPRYRISAQSGPDHRKIFTVDVSVKGRKLGEGRGSNKKKAEQSAARDALEALKLL